MSNLEAIKSRIAEKRRQHAKAGVDIETASARIKETRATLKKDFGVVSADDYKGKVAEYDASIKKTETELTEALETAEGGQ